MTIAPPEGAPAIDQSAEPWMPNGFPPPSFVVEVERTTTFAAGKGRWLAAAAILGAVLLIAGLLLIARSGDDDRTDLATSGSTTSTVAAAPGPFTPSQVDPTQGDPSANTTPTILVDPNATTAPAAPGATTTVVAAPPVPGAPPPPPPGVLEAPGGITLPTAFTNRPPVSGSATLRNTGPTALTYGSEVGTGIAVTPPTGTIEPGASAALTVTFTPGGLPETEPGKAYVGRVVFNGSGGTRTMEVRTVIARPPTISSARQDGKYVVRVLDNQAPCEGGRWLVRANVADQPAGVRDVTVFISSNGGTPVGTPMTRRFGTATAGIWELEQPPTTRDAGLRITSIKAVDNHGAEAEVKPNELVCPAP